MIILQEAASKLYHFIAVAIVGTVTTLSSLKVKNRLLIYVGTLLIGINMKC